MATVKWLYASIYSHNCTCGHPLDGRIIYIAILQPMQRPRGWTCKRVCESLRKGCVEQWALACIRLYARLTRPLQQWVRFAPRLALTRDVYVYKTSERASACPSLSLSAWPHETVPDVTTFYTLCPMCDVHSLSVCVCTLIFASLVDYWNSTAHNAELNFSFFFCFDLFL